MQCLIVSRKWYVQQEDGRYAFNIVLIPDDYTKIGAEGIRDVHHFVDDISIEAHINKLWAHLIWRNAFKLCQLGFIRHRSDKAETIPIRKQRFDWLPDLHNQSYYLNWHLADMQILCMYLGKATVEIRAYSKDSSSVHFRINMCLGKATYSRDTSITYYDTWTLKGFKYHAL